MLWLAQHASVVRIHGAISGTLFLMSLTRKFEVKALERSSATWHYVAETGYTHLTSPLGIDLCVNLQEQYITAKYVERRYSASTVPAVRGNVQTALWEAVEGGSIKYDSDPGHFLHATVAPMCCRSILPCAYLAHSHSLNVVIATVIVGIIQSFE